MALAPDVKTLDDKQIVAKATALITRYSVYAADELPRLHPETITPDPDNRDGIDLHAGGAVRQAISVHNAGFVSRRTRTVNVEFPDDQRAKDDLIKYNVDLSTKQPGLPDVKVSIVAFSGIGGSHTNAFLRKQDGIVGS